MLYQLKQIAYKDIEQYDSDYCRRANDPYIPEEAHYYGIYRDATLVSYFAVSDGINDSLFIQRGFVLPEYRVSGEVRNISLTLLEDAAKKTGYRAIEFESTRNPLAYIKMFKQHGYKPRYVGFRKYI